VGVIAYGSGVRSGTDVGRAGTVDASERLAHLGAEIVGDVISGDPASSALLKSDGFVCDIGFGADDNDPFARIDAELVAAAIGKGRTVDDHEIGLEFVHYRAQVIVADQRVPATVLAFEELEDHAAHRRVGHGDRHAR
jgi:hypothetical protein